MKTLFLIILFVTQSYAQTQFEVAVGGPSCDNGWYVIQTSDGGYVLCGNSEISTDPFDMYIVKLDPAGLLQWTQKIGGVNGEWAYSIVQSSDGGYIAAGFTGSYGAGGQDLYIVRLSSGGNVLWNKTIGGTLQDNANSIKQTTDGGFIIGGSTRSFGAGGADMFIIKIDSGGSVLWSKTVGGTGDDIINYISQTTDGGYIAAGSTSSFGAGASDMYIVKFDTSGNVVWNRTFGGGGIDVANSVIQTTDNSYVVAGETHSFGAGNYDFYVVKLDNSGNILWSKTVGSSLAEGGESIIQTPDGGYAAVGYQQRLVKLDSAGTLQWSRSLPIVSICIIKTLDGGYAVGGHIEIGDCDDFSILKFDGNWNTCSSISSLNFVQGSGGSVTSPVPSVSLQTPMITTPTPQSITYGIMTPICTTVGVTNNAIEKPGNYNLSLNYPNPFNPSTKIKFSLPKPSFVKLIVYDVTGKEVQTLVNEKLEAGSYEKTFDASSLSSGVYFYKLTAGDFSSTKKMVMIK